MSRSTLKTAPPSTPRSAKPRLQRPRPPVAAGKKGAPKDKAVAAAAPKGAGEIRIIGGQWKRTRLPVAQRPGLRPTPDRVRETLFNWLGQDLTGWRCLDAFAGTGALGLEAASRGAAASVQLVESDAALVAQLHTLQASAFQATRRARAAWRRRLPPSNRRRPPASTWCCWTRRLTATCSSLPCRPPPRLWPPRAFIYLEAPRAWTDEELAASGLVLYRHLKAGAVHAHLLQRSA